MKRRFLFLWTFLALTNAACAQQSIEDSLNKVIAAYKDEAEVARAYNALGYEYTRKDVTKARAYFEEAIRIGKKINNLKRLSSSYSSLVHLLHKAGYPDSAEYYIGKVKNIAMQADPSEQDALYSNYNVVAAMYYKNTGVYQKAIPYFEKAIALFIKMGDKESTAGQMLNLGNTYTAIGNYKMATEQHLKSLRLFEEINNRRGISYCYQSLSNSFTELEQYGQALVYANKSLEIKKALNDRRGICSAESGLGGIYFGMGNFDKALHHYVLSLNIAREQKTLPDEQGALLNIAKVYAATKNTKQAIAYFTQSRLLAVQLHDSSSIASIDGELIALQHRANNIDSSENKIKTSIELFKEQGDLNRQAAGFKNLAELYTATKQYDKALEFKDKYYEVLDSIRNNDLQIQVKKMEELYNVEKKEKEITLLKKDKELQEQILKRRNLLMIGAAVSALLALCGIWLLMNRNKMRQQMKELELRNRIAADLHDEVGSSLSSIHMLSQLAGKASDEITHKDILQRMSNNAKETMDKMGDIVWMIKPAETEAGSLKQRMERFAYEICGNKNIDTSIEVNALDTLKLTTEQRKNIYLIFKEALNNAVKYSNTEHINIDAVVKNKNLVLTIKDFGQGFNDSLRKKGNGLENMKHRAEELNAGLRIDSAINTGTAVALSIPV